MSHSPPTGERTGTLSPRVGSPAGRLRSPLPGTAPSLRMASPMLTGGGFMAEETKKGGIFSDFLTEAGAQDVTSGPRAPSGPAARLLSSSQAVQRPPSVQAFRKPESADGFVQKRKTPSYTPVQPQYDPVVLEPKVMAPYERAPGQTPRKIEIERKKRLFAQQDIEQLLLNEGVDFMKGDPEEDNVVATLPLELFDDHEWDSRTLQEWASLSIDADGGRRQVPVRALHSVSADSSVKRWLEGHMLEMDEERGNFLVSFTSLGVKEWLPRIHVMFLAEDPFVFAKRVAAAYSSRKEAASLLWYNMCVHSMPTEALATLTLEQKKRILAVATGAPRQVLNEEHATPHVEEVDADFSVSMNRSGFDAMLSDPEKRDQFSISQLPEKPPHPKREVPWTGTVPVPAHDFPTQFNDFTFHSFFTNPSVINALVKVRAECNRIEDLCIFNVKITKSVRLDEFEQLQTLMCTQVASQLKEGWLHTLRTGILSSLKDVSKGWFNLKLTNKEVYDISKLKKFMLLVRFMMEDSLRFLVERSLVLYTQFIQRATTADIVVNNTNDVVVTETEIPQLYIEGVQESVLGTSLPSMKRSSLFVIDLVMVEKADGMVFDYSTSLDLFHQVPVQMFHRAITAMQNVPQLEPQIMEELFKSTIPVFVASVHEQEPPVLDMTDVIRDCFSTALEPLREYLSHFDPYLELLNLDVQQYTDDYAAEEVEHTVEEFREEIERIHVQTTDIEDMFPHPHISIGVFAVNCEVVRSHLAQKSQEQAKLILQLLAHIVRGKSDEICRTFGQVIKRLMERPKNIEELTDLRQYINGIPEINRNLHQKIAESQVYYQALSDFQFNLTAEDFNIKWIAFGGPQKVEDQVMDTNRLLDLDQSRFLKDMQSEQESFTDEVQELSHIIAGFKQHTDIEKVDEIAEQVRAIKEHLERCETRAKLFNSRESLFGKPKTEYSQLYMIIRDFQPFINLWLYTQDWMNWSKSWMDDSFNTLHAGDVESNVLNATKAISKVVRSFKDSTQLLEIAERVRKELTEFEPSIKLILSLRAPGMRKRHWDQISKDLKLAELKDDDTLTLRKMLGMNLDAHIEEITRVSEISSKEWAIESALDKMENEWDDVEFTIVPYRETGTCIMKGADEIQSQLDDHIVMTQSMTFSVYKKPFEERIETWESRLSLVAEILEEWLVCQRQWLYLEPIFSSDDILMQMPTEGKRYAMMDRIWRRKMSEAKDTPQVLRFCSSEKLLEDFQECNKLLEQVQRGLSAYLESKRTIFTRFYFLSNDEMLEILSQARDPRAVQPHLRKCFENVAKLTFEEDLTIKSMVSGEGEVIPLREPFQPKGNVENWLLDVEEAMITSVRNQLRMGLVDYERTKRTDWVQKWPGQVVLAGSQIYWTQACVNSIKKNELAKLQAQQISQLNNMTELVQQNVSALVMMTLSSLIVVDVHARDVVANLVKESVNNITDFEWLSQMRYYWDGEDCHVEMMNASFDYGYEYLGNTSRLVITPLTDRCYLTLTSALQLQLGGAPQGPAGTGKTETTKDLAKALAKQCVVFNCSDGLDYLAMGKFFKGLASSGAWACFDEFNRIDLEVLSVIAQQILSIQKAIQQQLKRFTFESTDIALNPTCAVFITMNPGYAGRTELPDNLKALFRPVAMMIPDYAMIAEIMLFSFGFKTAGPLAQKMVATFRLSSEQLSSQDHYDFGMRAVKAVISAAGNLKQKDPTGDEQILLLRALNDVNIPKFLVDDLPLFNGIISDLFPEVEKPNLDYGNLQRAIEQAATELHLQPSTNFILKCIQLYDTMQVRHGLMLVGPTGGGKTCCYRVLAKALTALSKMEGVDDPTYKTVHIDVVNPKSIKMGQLYGEFDITTHEWTEGILASVVREGSKDTKDQFRWCVLDGPVDALWIESMNTVLDDNKKLCLTNGEIIHLTERMTMCFEVEDLAVASPATVSRCGMVYIEPTEQLIFHLTKSWLDTLPPEIAEHVGEKLPALLDRFLQPALNFARKNLKELVPTSNHQLTQGLLNILQSFFTPYMAQKELQFASIVANPDTSFEASELGPMIESLFIFALTWSVGAIADAEGRIVFDEFVRAETAKSDSPISSEQMPPSTGTIYDYLYDVEQKSWLDWMSRTEQIEIDLKANFSEIVVPTRDTVRSSYLLNLLLTCGYHVLCVGPTGTGKSVAVSELLLKNMPEKYQPVFVNFSARTSANQTQDILDAKFDKRRKGVFGPPVGRKSIIFVDDLNMPGKEQYGAQPAIELLRQWMDHRGWFDRKLLQYKEIVDIQFVGAMGPPGGGRTAITNRFVRHFNMLNFVELANESLEKIFNSILGAFLDLFEKDISMLCEPIVDATVQVYRTICQELLPTPSKSHYTYNLRDFSAVFQGMLSADASRITEQVHLGRLWCHESKRVFQDRLIDDKDRAWFMNVLKRAVEDHLPNMSWSDIMTSERLMYGDYLIPNAYPKVYQEVTDLNQLVGVMNEYLEDYNVTSSTPMKLVMFMDCIEHISRVSRIIRQPKGNALLLGVGGSGKRSVTRLACFMAEYTLKEIEVIKGFGMTEWREDLKNLLFTAGLEAKPIVFLFSDTQIVFEGMLEDINNILNSGEVPNLFSNDELESINTTISPVVQSMGQVVTKASVYAQFIHRVRQNLHVVLCMSPIGSEFRNRLRMFPSLVNCCTLNWFDRWPQEALSSVAENSLREMELGDTPINAIIEMCAIIHQTVEEKAKIFSEIHSRPVHVTPTSYLELLMTFAQLLKEKRLHMNGLRRRLERGLDKLISTAGAVEGMQAELNALQPVLEQTTKENEEMMLRIARDKVTADETRTVVAREEVQAGKKAEETKAIADDAKRDLDEALPALEAAVSSLKKLNKADVYEVRMLLHPPQGVKLVIEAVCIMKGLRPKKVDGQKPGQKVDDYWDVGRQMLTEAKFLDSLFNFDRDNIPEYTIQKIQPYIKMEEFQPERVAMVSKACTSLCLWVRAMERYYWVARSVAPKRERLKTAQQALENTLKVLNDAKWRLREVEENIKDLEKKYDESVIKKEELARKVDEVRQKLDRAQKLIMHLGGEKDRWHQQIKDLEKDHVNLIGDVLISAGSLAYGGPFTKKFREDLVEVWHERLKGVGIPCTPGANALKTISEPVKLRQWQINGLPRDDLSIVNAIIVDKARRWPLMIDPQRQANKWVRNMEKDNGLDIVRLTDRDFVRRLENAIQFGKPMLIENVGEELDTILEPVLQRQVFKQGGNLVIKVGDSVIPYHTEFRLYITTRLRNPSYKPEVFTKVSILNFALSLEGLDDQLLSLVVGKERMDLENAKSELVLQNAKMHKDLKELEDKILMLIGQSSGNILEDEVLIDTLASSKKMSAEITEKVKETEKTEREIDSTRLLYRPVSTRGAVLFFCISDLANIDPMYQYSLGWYIALFSLAIDNATQSTDLDERLANLNDHFTLSLYTNICRSLFEKDKLLFSFLLTIRTLQSEGSIDSAEWRFLLSGISSSKKAEVQENPCQSWLSDKSWGELCQLSGLPSFHGLADLFRDPVSAEQFRKIYEEQNAENCDIPAPFEKVNQFQKLLILRCLRLDRIMAAVQEFISDTIGRTFIEPPTFDLTSSYKDSSCVTPLIFVLSSGADPTADLYRFAEDMRFAKKLHSISLGQGQGPRAEGMIEEACERGSWVILQNCHLAPSWMPQLENIVENLSPDTVHRDFRLWLTSMPSKEFPVSVLQAGVKMTNEPPKGIRANLLRSYAGFDENFLLASKQPKFWRKLLFSLCFFHAAILERRKFGALGWNIAYEFTSGDLDICIRQLQMFLANYDDVPYKTLKFLTGHINYGGRVTDDKDRRTLMTILDGFYTPDVLKDAFQFSPSGLYLSPEVENYNGYVSYLRQLPFLDEPEVFGMHSNADISATHNEVNKMFDSLITMQPREVDTSTSGGVSRDDQLMEMASDILRRLPEVLRFEDVEKKYPVMYEESMNTVLQQEVIRFNRLLERIKATLMDLQKAIKGLVVMSEALERMADSLYNNRVPDLWEDVAYPSLKPLSAWVTDLEQRLEFIKNWFDNGIPSVFWISGFFFPQAFLTGTLQNYARKFKVSIDTVSFDYQVMTESPEELKKTPKNGCYISGLFLEGASWDFEKGCLAEGKPKQLYTQFPVIWLKPVVNRKIPESGIYTAPVYKTLTRAGVLTTTGHSSNFVVWVDIPSDKPQSYWIKHGAALICSLNY